MTGPAGPGGPWPGPLNPPPGSPWPRELCVGCMVPRSAWDTTDPAYGEQAQECPECQHHAIALDHALMRREDI